MSINFQHTINALPAAPAEDLKSAIKNYLRKINKTIIVLDDDPTGTQTMHDVPVLTSWDEATIDEELKKSTALFYILTNSRSMPEMVANDLGKTIGNNIRNVFEKNKKEYIIISRGDSTLRGHYPNEVDSLTEGLQIKNYTTAIIPAFFEGGRCTIDDVHYVKEGEELIPAADTEFAKDKAFGFSQSNLKNWVEEKTNGNIKAAEIVSFSIDELRNETVEQLSNKIITLPSNATVIVNAAAYYDLEKFALAYLRSEVEMIFRTAASFVKALSANETKLLLTKEELTVADNMYGGLIVVGSYVPKTTKQLQALHGNKNLSAIEIPVTEILNSSLTTASIANKVETLLANGKDVVMYSSRNLQAGIDEKESLAIGNRVADFITAVVQQINVLPKFMIAKGGITSSDIAVKALGIKRAMVLGQALPGVPVWKAGAESKFAGLPYIIFPGNVGDDDALALLYEKLC
jgi:uncharacterized protein YgbK (DUF1537 family)